MTLKLYDTSAKALREFTPLVEGHVGVYVCGATVQGSPHIGHIRSALAFDVLQRWLERSGYEVTMVRNVTDIDDKILAKSAEAGRPWWAWAYRFEREFADAYDALGLRRPTYEPRATAHMTDMFDLIGQLIEAGHAYVGDPGNVYFDVASLPGYGSLTHQSIKAMAVDEDGASDKRGVHDFALWKAPKYGEPDTASWDSPWGRGRPGWHLECSAMAGRYLGAEFDIHGGGIDLRFPHHENEQAQSRGAGRGFARYWMHNAWVTIKGEKMSKSLGNSLVVSEILKSTPAPVLRLALATVHYRSTVEYSDTTLSEAQQNWTRMTGFLDRAEKMVGPVDGEKVAALTAADYPEAFREAMNDDLNVSAAFAVIHETVTAANKAMTEKKTDEVAGAALAVRAMLDVLGVDPRAPQWSGASSSTEGALDTVVASIIEARSAARANKDWAQADALRDLLAQAGIVVEDSADGATWHVKENR